MQEVFGDAFGRRARLAQGLRRGAVGTEAERLGQVVVDGVADDGSDEAHGFPAADDADVAQYTGGFHGLVRVQAGDARELGDAVGGADDGEGPRQCEGVLRVRRGCVLDPAEHHACDVAGPDAGDGGGVGERLGARGAAEFTDEFAQEERVPGRGLVAGAHRLGGERPGAGGREEFPHAGLAERTEAQQPGADGAEQRPSVVAPGGPGGDGGDAAQDGPSFEPLGQVAQEAQGGGVRPLEVVQQEQERSVPGHVDQRAVEAVVNGLLLLGVELAGHVPLVVVEEGRGHGGGTGQHGRALLRCGGGKPVLQRLADHPVGESRLEFDAAGMERGESRLFRPLPDGSQQ